MRGCFAAQRVARDAKREAVSFVSRRALRGARARAQYARGHVQACTRCRACPPHAHTPPARPPALCQVSAFGVLCCQVGGGGGGEREGVMTISTIGARR